MTSPALRWGLHLPNYGEAWGAPGLGDMAVLVEQAGFDSVWLSDHVVLVEDVVSRYPFSADGSFFLAADQDWLEWTTVAGYLAARTSQVEIGVGVCVLPLRHPLLLAKQVATLDRLSGGRIVLGAGAGWMAEEFAALGLDFGARGAAMDGGLALLRAAWEGAPPAGKYGPYDLPPGVHCRPTPVRSPVPLYFGGESRAAFRRLAEHGQGWYGTSVGGGMPLPRLAETTERIAQACRDVGRDPAEVEIALRLSAPSRALGTPGLRDELLGYVRAGVTRFSFDVAWPAADVMADRLAALRQTTHDVQAQLAPSA